MKKARQEAETLKTANRPKRRDASAVAGLGCRGGLAGKALQLRVFAPLLFISARPVPLIHLSFTSKQLVLTVDRAEDVLLEKCRDVAITALKELPHTPLMAVGVNYHFIAEQPDDALLQVFNLSDNNSLSDADVKIRSTVIQRSLIIQDQTVNLSLTLAEDKKVHVAFNFHKETPNTEQAVAFLGAHSTDLKEKAFDLLNKIYQSTVETVAATV
jgi:hypothetical protein